VVLNEQLGELPTVASVYVPPAGHGGMLPFAFNLM
jgi:hypothetical protein